MYECIHNLNVYNYSYMLYADYEICMSILVYFKMARYCYMIALLEYYISS